MTIHVLSFDFDGCLFNTNYIFSTEKDVIKSNLDLLNALKKEQSQYTKSIVFVGSIRQSKGTDEINAYLKGSCFPAIKKVADYLKARLDSFLLADIYGNLPDGTSFAQAISDDSYTKQHAHWRCDETKATILYAQMHKIACQHPNEKIVFDFYDDRGETEPFILKHLHKFYSENPQLIPQNVHLRLNHYAGAAVTPLEPIKGTGFVDENYRQTVKDMAAQAMYVSGKDGLSNPLQATHFVQAECLGNRKPLYIAQLSEQLSLIRKKAKTFKADGYDEAASKANDLQKTIKTAAKEYFSGALSKEQFKQQCDAAIEIARPELEKHRGWKECLTNLALVVLGVVGIVIKGGINIAQNRAFFFVAKTESAKTVDQLEDTVEKIAALGC